MAGLHTRMLALIAVALPITASAQRVNDLSETIDVFSTIAVTASAQASSSTRGSQASVGAATSTELAGAEAYHNGMRVFTMAVGGLMYQATIAGQRYNFRPLR